MNVTVISGPSYEPVTLAEAKLWCRIDDDDTDQDAMVLLLIIATREYAEHYTGRAFVQRTVEMRMKDFPAFCDPQEIELPYPPLRSIVSLSYVDTSGAVVTMNGSPDEYQLEYDSQSTPARIAPLPTTDWPDVQDVLAGVRVRYVCGYATINAIPKTLKLWMQTRIATLYENREQFAAGYSVDNIKRDFVDGLLDSLKVNKSFA